MKKNIIALMGLFALVACSEDVYQDAEMQNEETGSQYQTNSFNNDHSGHTTGGTFSDTLSNGRNYVSPWDIWYKTHQFGDLQPNYIISNGNVENLSNFNIRVYAHVGLAYFDGTNDGTLSYDITQLPFTPDAPGGPIVDMATSPTLYPNLWDGVQEVGHLVRTSVPFNVAANTSVRIEDKTKHLLLDPAMGGNAKYPTPQPFVFPASVTGQEQTLLAEFGKVFFYEVFVTDSTTGAAVAHAYLHPEIKTLPSGAGIFNPEWQAVLDLAGTTQMTGNAPGMGPVPLHFYRSSLVTRTVWFYTNPTNDKCDSREVVFDLPTPMNAFSLPGGKTLHLGVLESSLYGWLNSSLYLGVY